MFNPCPVETVVISYINSSTIGPWIKNKHLEHHLPQSVHKPSPVPFPLPLLFNSNSQTPPSRFGLNHAFHQEKICSAHVCLHLRERLRLKDLTIVLYLLGFSGSDVRALRKRRWDNGPGEAKTTSSVEAPPSSKRFMLQVGSEE